MSSHLRELCNLLADREPAFSELSLLPAAHHLSPHHCQSFVSNSLVPLLVLCGMRVRQIPIPAAVVNMSNFVMSPINPRRNHAVAVAPGNISKGIMIIDRQMQGTLPSTAQVSWHVV